MNVHISRDGKQFGPYPVEQLEPMLRSGNIVPTDLVLLDGAKEWIPLGHYLESRNPGSTAAVRSPTPPPRPPAGFRASDTGPGGQLLLDGKIIAGTHGFTAADLEREVEAGGRFVCYSYCVSVVIMTFKRHSEVVFLKGTDDGFSHAFTTSLISLTVGWWGFPWGPIWTIASLVTNVRGGNDFTDQILPFMLPPDRIRALAERRSRPAPAGILMNTFRVALIAVPLLLIGLFVRAVYTVNAPGGEDSRTAQFSTSTTPGEAEFKAADDLIDFNKGTTAFGNTPKAIEVAGHFSKGMKARREAEFSTGKSGSASATKGEFLSYCKLDANRCLILVHVPELRRYDADAKAAMAYLAWECAEAALKAQGVGGVDNKPMALVVGVRGMLLYDRVLSGKYVNDPSQLADSIPHETTGPASKDTLHRLFLPQ